MVDTAPSVTAGTPASKGLIARFIGVVISPRETYEDVARRPGWAPMLLLLVAIGAACGGWISSTDVGRRAALDEAARMSESLGIRIPDAAYARMRERIMDAPAWRMYLQAVFGALFIVGLGGLVAAAILLGVFNAVLGGDAKFAQVFAVVIHSQVILTVKAIFVTPLNYARESMSNPTTFAALLPMLDDTSLAARILGSVDFFWLWWLTSLGIGLAVLYRRRARPVVTSLISVYVVLAVVIATALALFRRSAGG